MKSDNLKRTVTKKAPMNDQDLFRQVVDRFWQDAFRELRGSFAPQALQIYGEENFFERVALDSKKEDRIESGFLNIERQTDGEETGTNFKEAENACPNPKEITGLGAERKNGHMESRSKENL